MIFLWTGKGDAMSFKIGLHHFNFNHDRNIGMQLDMVNR